MLRKVLRNRWTWVALAVLVVVPIAFADYWLRGVPCHAERTTYFSDASKTQQIGVGEFICWQGFHMTGQASAHWNYEYLGPCCYCPSGNTCEMEP